MKKMEKLESEIKRHNDLYWKKQKPEISDADYDKLIIQLRRIDPENFLLKDIGEPKVVSSGKVRHLEPMLSLNKAYTIDEVVGWANSVARDNREVFVIEPKYDGIAAEFRDGVLSTRGDGDIGENITDKIPLIEGNLTTSMFNVRWKSEKSIKEQRAFIGEIVITKKEFASKFSNVTRANGEKYKNSRNAVAGILNLDDITEMTRQNVVLTLVDYDVFKHNATVLSMARILGNVSESVKAESYQYPADGLVIKLADKDYSKELGNTSHHPRGQIALKFGNPVAKTELLDIELSFGKNCLTPVAIFEPIELGGVTVTRASLHNLKNLIEKNIHIGDILTVERAGDVIPYVKKSKPGKHRKSIKPMLSWCPSCKKPLEHGEVELRCVNPNCPETILARITASARQLGIEGIGEPTIRKMITQLHVKDICDILDLTVDDLKTLEGFAYVSAVNARKEIDKVSNAPDYAVLASLNIPSIGKTLAKRLMEKYTIAQLSTMNESYLENEEGFGPERSRLLYEGIRENYDLLARIANRIDITQTNGVATEEDGTICFTGKMPEVRSYYANIANTRGFRVVDSVTKELTLLVTADEDSNSSKAVKAKKLGVRMITLKEWL